MGIEKSSFCLAEWANKLNCYGQWRRNSEAMREDDTWEREGLVTVLISGVTRWEMTHNSQRDTVWHFSWWQNHCPHHLIYWYIMASDLVYWHDKWKAKLSMKSQLCLKWICKYVIMYVYWWYHFYILIIYLNQVNLIFISYIIRQTYRQYLLQCLKTLSPFT